MSHESFNELLKILGPQVQKDKPGIASSDSSHEDVSQNTGQRKKQTGSPTKFKFHNVRVPIKTPNNNGGSPFKISSSDYNKYIKKFQNGTDCGGSHCRDLGYRDHYHCHDCNFKVFIKKEEMIRHYKWHKKRDESLQHGFLRFSPVDDCSIKYGNCTHNKRQTHYHCIQSGCDKVYISTSDVQMHANYHRKDSAIIQEGFQRFRATEDCGTTTCGFYGQRTTHFHCRRSNCSFTFKNKADMEKHKSYHQKDEILGRDGFKKFMKYEHCSYHGCRFSKVSNHIHCIRPGCSYVLHSTAQLYSHKRKHERREFENLYRTFRQVQRPQIQPAPAQLNQLQPNSISLAATVAGLSASVVAISPKVSLTTIPIQGYGEPRLAQTVVASQLLQPVTIPVKLSTASATVRAPAVTLVSTEAQTSAVVGNSAIAVEQAQALSSAQSDSSTDTSSTTSKPAVSVKEEPASDMDVDTESKPTKSTGTSTLPFSIAANLENVKRENLCDSLPLPTDHASKAEPQESLKETALKPLADTACDADSSSSKAGQKTLKLLPIAKRTGAHEKRERDETWKHYLIRYTANDPCNSRCQLLYKDHYHCKILGCQVLFRSKDGVREHAKFHDLQDRISPMVYDRYDSTQSCPQDCQFSKKQTHFHCNWTGCHHIIPEFGQTFARLEHYRIHEYTKAAAGKNYRMQNGPGGVTGVEDLAHRRRGRPPKYPRLNLPAVPKVELSEQEIQESSQQAADGEGAGADEKVINGFQRFDSSEICPDDQCMYRLQLHYHCGRPRCHTATDRIDVLNLHAKDFHSFVTILENFEFFDRNVNCRRSHCGNNRTNRHYHCIRPRCDYSFVRHSTMAQHDKKHTSAGSPATTVASSLLAASQITPIHLLRRPDGNAYIPIVPAPVTLDKSIVKASGTFYPLSGLTVTTSTGQQLTSSLTLTIPASFVTAGVPLMAPMTSSITASTTTNIVPVIAGNIVAGAAIGRAITSAPPLTVLLQQKPGNGIAQPSWSSMRSSMHYSLRASCGRPFCKLKKKDHYHCMECNQAFSDPARLRGHVSKHGVKFKKLAQAHLKASSTTPLPFTMVQTSDHSAPEMGLDLSTSKLKHVTAGNEERETNKFGMVKTDSDILPSSFIKNDNKISSSLSEEAIYRANVSEDDNEKSLVIDEDLNHSESENSMLDESMNGDEDEEEDLSMSDISLSTNASPTSSPSISRRSGRKRMARKHTDFDPSDDANILAKQMKLKLSAPIPSTVPAPPLARHVPDGFIRFHCSNDCGYLRCAYRQSVTHYHCVRPECGYGFSDKSRILQHQFRHERLDKLMGEEFQQFRATVKCVRNDCEFSEKASHFHCEKCAFVCADSSKVLAHRKYHTKMDNISSNGFQKYSALQNCGITMCTYSRKQTHYHCIHDGCHHAVLGPAQMAPHKLKHASHDV